MAFFKVLTRALLLGIVLTLTILSDSPAVLAEQESQPGLPFVKKLQDTLDNGLKKYNGKGISFAIIAPGHKMWIGVSGVSHGTTPIKPETLFDAGSITKNFVAALTLKLVEESLLTLDDTLHKWLPDYPNIDNTITIRQLLNHTSGLYSRRWSHKFGQIWIMC